MEKSLNKAHIVCTPGFEGELLQEMQEVWPYFLSLHGGPQVQAFPEVEKFKGGIEIPCDFFSAVQFNFFLHLATRVLWRITEFNSRDFPKMYQKLKKINWNQWLSSSSVDWHISAAHSRLNNEKRIEQVAKDVLKETKIPTTNITSSVFIRVIDDSCTVSLDLSGEPLYKRIENKKIGEAPFRETWANFVLRRMMAGVPLAELNKIQIVDPFCGSGTFLFEAAYFNFPNFRRRFAFQDLVQAPKLFKSTTFPQNYKWPLSAVFGKGWGFDRSSQMIQIASSNNQLSESHFKAPSHVEFLVQEALRPQKRPEGPIWLVANPPWGQRLGQDLTFEALVEGLITAWRPQKMALILPTQFVDMSFVLADYDLSENISLKLGGTEVSVLIWNCKV